MTMNEGITLREYVGIAKDQRIKLTTQALEEMLARKQYVEVEDEDGQPKKEVFQPVSAVLKWIRGEVDAIIATVNHSFGQPIKEETAVAQLQELHERFQSLMDLLTIVMTYSYHRSNLLKTYKDNFSGDEELRKLNLVIALDYYHEQFVGKVNDYFKNEPQKTYRGGNISPFIPEILDLPFSLFSLTEDQLMMFRIYVHDLTNILGSTATMLELGLQPEGSMSDFESRKDAFQSAQKKLAKLIVFHKQFDFDKLDYKFIETPLQDSRAAIQKNNKKFEDLERFRELQPGKIQFVSRDHTKHALAELIKIRGSNQEEKINYEEFSSLFSEAFLESLFDNVRQNTQRVNDKLKFTEKRIRTVVTDVTYEDDSFIEKPPQVPGQMTITDERGDERAVWITITIQDDGPGFPEEEGSELDLKDVILIQYRDYSPEENKSTHDGQGIFLDTLQKNVTKAGGAIRIYTDLINGGAGIYISFPLLRKPLDDELF